MSLITPHTLGVYFENQSIQLHFCTRVNTYNYFTFIFSKVKQTTKNDYNIKYGEKQRADLQNWKQRYSKWQNPHAHHFNTSLQNPSKWRVHATIKMVAQLTTM